MLGICATAMENGADDGQPATMDSLSERAFEEARRAHINVVVLRQQWREIETAPGVYEDTMLDWVNRVHEDDRFEAILALDPVDGFVSGMPLDLQGTPFDDPIVIERYKKMLDHALSRLSNVDVNLLLVGNEVSPYLEQTGQWQAYTTFYEAVGSYARSVAGVDVGATGIGPSDDPAENKLSTVSAQMQALNQHSDVISLTYYPALLETSFDWLVATYADKPIVVTEIGFPSSHLVGSSEALQAAAVRQVFEAWDQHATQVSHLVFFTLHDMSAEEAQGWEDLICQEIPEACGEDPGVIAALMSSFGLRTYSGSGADKEGFIALIEEAEARGW